MIVSHRTLGISDNLSKQLMDKLRGNYYTLQVDKVPDMNHLFAYIQFIDGRSLKEEMLVCENFETNTNVDCIFDISDKFLKENKQSLDKCVGIWTDGSHAISGQYNGLQAKVIAPCGKIDKVPEAK